MHLPLFSHRSKLLSQHRPYRLGTQWPDDGFRHTEQSQYPDRGQLTDGRAALPQVKDPCWIGLLRQYGRSVTVDLGDVCLIHETSIRFLQNPGAGIQVPDWVHFYASLDGVHWRAIGHSAMQLQWHEETQPAVRTYSCSGDSLGRFVRAQFTAKVYAFVSQYEVIGQSKATADPALAQSYLLSGVMGDDYLVDPEESDLPAGAKPPQTRSARRQTPAGYLLPSDPQSGFISHMQLIYTGSHTAQDTWTMEDFLPTVAICDEQRTPLAPLFDGALFLPYGKMETTAKAWADWLDDLFSPNVQLHALDAAAGALKAATKDASYQIGVVITLPGTNKNPSHFGALAPGARPLDCNPATAGLKQAAENKRAALLWLLAQVEERFRRAAFSHLRLAGLYWHPETVSLSDPYDPWLISEMAAAIHDRQLLFYWIPLYGAIGLPYAHELGFDTVIIQPNAAFHPEIDPAKRLQMAAQIAKHYGLGIEIELHWDINNGAAADKRAQAQKLYEAYLAAGRELGYAGDGAAKAYYLNTKSLVTCFASPFDEARKAYTDTAAFVQHKN